MAGSDIASRSPRTRVQTGRAEELAQIIARLAVIAPAVHTDLVEARNEAAASSARVAELEAQNAERCNLSRTSPRQRDAERKLKIVRRGLQGILRELGPEYDSESSTSFGHHKTSSVTSTPRSAIIHGLATPRGSEHPRRRGRRGPATVPPSPVAPSTHSSVASTRGPAPKRTPSVGPQVDKPIRPASSAGPSLDTTLTTSRINLNDDWRMSASRSPASAGDNVCPIPFAYLEERLKLDEDALYSLESLMHTDDLSFHVQIVHDMAFVYEPIAMDKPGMSILFDFGTPADNRMTADYINSNLPDDGIFHTFTFPSRKDSKGQTSWYYIGAHKWSIEPPTSIWQALSEKPRGYIIARLIKQCKNKYSVAQLYQMLQEGQLEAFCVEVSSTSCRQLSHAFATNILGYAPRSSPRGK